nr:DUF2971 domain-containing protein [Halomonas sp. UBA1491]
MLYKYSSMNEWSIINIFNNEIYFSEINSLNDGCEFSLNVDYDLKDKDWDAINNAILKLEKNLSNDLNGIDRNKLKKFHQRVENEKETNKNKLSYSRFLSIEFLSLIGEVYRTSSFSDCPPENSPIMWGHYADKITGICIGYEFDDKDFIKVEYIDDESIPELNIYEALERNSYNIAREILSYKSIDWSYESEYRIISLKDKMHVKDKEIKEVYFGFKADANKAKTIFDIVRGKNSDAKFYIVVPKKGSFDFLKFEIEKDDIDKTLKFIGGLKLGDFLRIRNGY